MPNIGPMEIIIVLVIALVVFGPKRLPDLGKSLGSGMRGFKDSLTGSDDKLELPAEVESDLPELHAPGTVLPRDRRGPRRS